MSVKSFLLNFIIAFAITFVVNAIVVWLYNLIAHGHGVFVWDTTFYFAITLGILYPILMSKRETKHSAPSRT